MRVVLLSVSTLALVGSGCASGGGIDPGSPAMMASEAPAGALTEYRLGAGDRLKIVVFGEDALGGEFQVAGEGTLSLPLIGDVRVAGLTVRELQSTLQQAYKDGQFLQAPTVNAEVLSYRPYYILGEVGKPGQYPYTSALTVLNAVATAEGFSYRANQRRVFVRRAGASVEEQLPLTSTTLVLPGDTIRIGERLF